MIHDKIRDNVLFTEIGILSSEQFDHVFKISVNFGPLFSGIDLFAEYFFEDFLSVAMHRPKWQLSRGNLLESDAQRELVGVVALLFAQEHLRSHLQGSPQYGRGEHIGRQALAGSKVNEFDLHIVIQHHVFWLYISVNDASLMEIP